MVGLDPQVVESIALTRQEGEAFLLDGNKLYFKYFIKGNRGKEEVKYGYVDLSLSRKTFKPVEWSEVPKWPQKQEVSVNVYEIAFGLWLINYAGAKHKVLAQVEYLPVRTPLGSSVTAKSRDQVTVKDFIEAATKDWSCAMVDGQPVKPSYWWGISEELMNKAKSIAEERRKTLEAKVNAGWRPTRVLSAEDTAMVLGIFNFDGDKKGLVTALLSWGVEIKDSEVKVDKLITKRIELPKTVEELIP